MSIQSSCDNYQLRRDESRSVYSDRVLHELMTLLLLLLYNVHSVFLLLAPLEL
jgi:hypothetical protein